MDVDVVPLHKHQDYLMQCCELINNEWKKDVADRMRLLESSKDGLPTSLILLKRNTVIGHAMLTPIPNKRESCYIESVVIDRKLRGLGYGKHLMESAEDYCRNYLKLKTIYLSTKDKERFYAGLGYVKCNPVTVHGSYNNNKGTKAVNQNVPVPAPKPKGVDPARKKVYMKKHIAPSNRVWW